MGGFQEEIKELAKKVKTRGLVINRIPKQIKVDFIDFADKEFEGDYGMCLKHIWDNYLLWKVLFENMDMKLDRIINSLENKPQEEEIRLLNGSKIKKIKREVKEDE